jgi:hypothetical protein
MEYITIILPILIAVFLFAFLFGEEVANRGYQLSEWEYYEEEWEYLIAEQLEKEVYRAYRLVEIENWLRHNTMDTVSFGMTMANGKTYNAN